jgi:hypothetical protein
MRQSAQLLDVLAKPVEVGIIIRTLDEIHLPGNHLALVGPLGVEPLPHLGLPELWVLTLVHMWVHGLLREHGLLWWRTGQTSQRVHGWRAGTAALSWTVLSLWRSGSFALAAIPLGALGLGPKDRASGHGIGAILVIMDTLHVVKQVVPPGKSISGNATFAAWVEAEVGTFTMAVHPVGLSFMPQKASRGRELLLGTGIHFAPEGLEVGVDELAVNTRVGQ